MGPKNHRSSAKSGELEAGTERARPLLHQKAKEIQPFGKLTPMPIALDENVRAPRGREKVPVQISRLLEAHELILKEARTMAKQADDDGDDGTNDLLISNVIRTNELQAWFIAEHVVDV